MIYITFRISFNLNFETIRHRKRVGARNEHRRKRWCRQGTFIRVEERRLILLSGMGGNVRHTALPSISAPTALFGPDPPPHRGRGSETEIASFQVDFPPAFPHLHNFFRIARQCLLPQTLNAAEVKEGWCEMHSVISDGHINYVSSWLHNFFLQLLFLPFLFTFYSTSNSACLIFSSSKSLTLSI